MEEEYEVEDVVVVVVVVVFLEKELEGSLKFSFVDL
jgi:hypothetical protein